MAEGTLRDEKRRERAKFSSMTKQQKLNYIKTYYLAPIVIVFVLIIFFIWFILETTVLHKEVIMSGCTVNVRISDETKIYLTDGLLAALNGNSKKEVVNLSSDNYVDYGKDEDAPYGENMNGYMDQTLLFTQIAAGEFSYMILDESALDNIGESGYIGVLDDTIDQSVLGEYDIYYDESGHAIGINLLNTQLKIDAYLVIAQFVSNDTARFLIDYIAKK